MRSGALSVSRRRIRGQKGNEIIEFAVMASFLVPTFLWLFINGMNLVRMIQCTQICRDIGNLYMQGVDFTTWNAQDVAATLAQGYGLQIGSSYAGNEPANDANSSGTAWVVLSEIMYVGNSACSSLPATTTCTNLGKYVYLMRIDFGNAAMTINGSTVQSALGTPSEASINSEGYVQNYLTDANAVAPNAGSYITLSDTQVAYVSETFFSSPTLSISALSGGGITARTFF